MTIAPRQPPFRHISFLLIPGFALLGFTNAVETLRATNQLLGYRAYRWSTLSTDGLPASANNGIMVPVEHSISTAPSADAAFVCADFEMDAGATPAVCRWLQGLERRGSDLGAISAATYVLARADVIRGRRCTIHWESAPRLMERHPEIAASRRVFEVDRGLYTCAGGMGVFDLFVRLVSAEHGKSVGDALGLSLGLDHIRSGNDDQRSVPLPQFEARPRKLQAAIREMEAAVESPISPEDIAIRVGITTRHLQRLFRCHTGVSPARFYMDLRLRQARLLLQQTHMPVLEVAIAVGFSSHSHFSKRYRERYNRTPQQERCARTEARSRVVGFSVPRAA